MALHTKMLWGFALGLAAGFVVHWFIGGDHPIVQWLMQWITQPIGKIFLRLLFMLVIPLLFSALVVGIAEMRDIRSLGSVGWKTLGYTVVVSSIAVILGISLVNLFQPGAGVDPEVASLLLSEASDNAQKIVASGAMQGTGIDMLLNIVPTNVIRAAADNDILAVMFFALMFGIGIVLTRSPLASKTKEVIAGVFEI